MDKIKKEREGLNRRTFLKGTAAGAFGLAAGSMFSASADAEPIMAEKVKKWNGLMPLF